MLKLSPSTLNLFNDCPRCFWLKFNKDIKRPAGIFPSLPSGMDKVLKIHFDSFMKKQQLPPELKSTECDDGTCKLFNDEEKLKIWRSNFKGIKYSEEDFTIHGAIDNLLVKGDKLIVLDYKTRGFPLKEDTHTHYQLQMDLYNFLLRKNGYKTEDYTFLLFYYPDKVTETGEVIFETKLIKLPTSPENGEKVLREAVKCLEGKEPEGDCEYCKYLKNELLR